MSSSARLGIYLTPTEFDNARAAYLADWLDGNPAATFAEWVAAAIDRHALRLPQRRQLRALPPKLRSNATSGSTKSFKVPEDTVARMRVAIAAEYKEWRWLSHSAWCAEALAFAVEAARAANGGSLPTPPPRLPPRLRRDAELEAIGAPGSTQ